MKVYILLYYSGLLPSFRALAVFTLRSDAEALLAGSFWSPALITSAVRGLQLGGISLRGGGSLAICNIQKKWLIENLMNVVQSRLNSLENRGTCLRCCEAYLQVKSTGIISCPRLTPSEHVQKHTAAAPHICFGSAGFPFYNLRGHVGLWAFQICIGLQGKQRLETWKWVHYPSSNIIIITDTGQDLPLHPLRLWPWLSSLSACPKSHRKVSLPSSDSSTLSAVGNKQCQWSTAVILTLLRELSGILTISMTCTLQFIDDIIRQRAAARTEISLTTKKLEKKDICQWKYGCWRN